MKVCFSGKEPTRPKRALISIGVKSELISPVRVAMGCTTSRTRPSTRASPISSALALSSRTSLATTSKGSGSSACFSPSATALR